MLQPYTFPTTKVNKIFPKDGLGSIVLQRKELVNTILQNVADDDDRAVYIRAPMGCGKTTLLHLVGQELLSRNSKADEKLKVFHVTNAGALTAATEAVLKSMSDSCQPGETIYLLVDEAHRSPDVAPGVWTYLIKDSVNIKTIAFGISQGGLSPKFYKKMWGAEVFLSESDLDQETLSSFLALGKPIHPNITSDNVKAMYKYVLSYTSGHVFPLLKMMEYLLTTPSGDHNNYNDVHFSLILGGKEFIESKSCSVIIERVYSFSPEINLTVDNIMRTSEVTEAAASILDYHGWWNQNTSWLISDFMMFCLYQQAPKTPLPENLTMDDIIALGLQSARTNHFFQREQDVKGDLPRFEISAGHFFGWNLCKYQRLYVSPQHRTDSARRSMIDYYINGKYNTFIELILDSGHVQHHFDKFEDGVYNNKPSYVILDLQPCDTEEVAKFPPGKEDLFYTFFLQSNSLYKGKQLVRANVSQFLRNVPAPKVLGQSSKVDGQKRNFGTFVRVARRLFK